MKPLYTARATATGGRAGHTKSDDGLIDLPLSVPKSMGGPGLPNTSNPEQLFAAGYSACFGGAMEHVARTRHAPIDPPTITAEVTFGIADDGAFQLGVVLIGRVPNREAAFTQELMEAAHQVCPYSRATRGNIEVVLRGEAA